MEDSLLAKKVKDENCEDSLKELISRHSKLCYAVYQRYFPAMRASGVTAEDAIDEKDLIIYKSAMSYNPTKKAKFSTWVGNQMRYACLNKMNKNKKYKPVLDDEIDLYIEIIIIGSGPGGYAAGFRAADLGRKVLIVDKDQYHHL